MKKRIIALILISVLSFSVFGCGGADNADTNNNVVNQEQPKDSLADAKKAYSLLVNSSETVDIIGSGIVGAWGYVIDNKSNYSATYNGLSKQCGLTKDEVKTAFEEYHQEKYAGTTFASYSISEGVMLSDFSEVIQVLTSRAYTPYFDVIDQDLAEAKKLIQGVDSNESYYSDLVAYYSAISNYLEWCKSPNGSYQSSSSTLTDYRNNMNTPKSNLSFYLE